MDSATPAQIKDTLREAAFGQRNSLDRTWRRQAARAIAARALALTELRNVQPVGGYWPIRSEVDPRPLLEALLARGQDVALSQILHPHLSWRLWQLGDVLVKGGFGVREPGPDAPECFPKALLVPLAAFDRRGGRLGYGAGYYDGAIADLKQRGRPFRLAGIAFSCQEVDEVPTEPHDEPLPLVATERELIRTGNRAAEPSG